MKACILLAGVLTSALAFCAPNPAYVPREADSVFVLDRLDQPAPQLDGSPEYLERDIADFKKLLRVNSLSYSEPLEALLGYHMEDGHPRLKAKSITVSRVTTEREKDFDVFLVVERPAIDLPTFVETLKKALAEQPADAPKPVTLEQQGDWWVLHEPVEPGDVEEFLGFRAIPDGLFIAYSTDEAFSKKVGAGEVPSIVGSESPLLEVFTPPPQEAIGPVFRMKTMQPPEEVLTFSYDDYSAPTVKMQAITGLVYASESNLFLSAAFQMADEASAQEYAEMLIAFKVMLRSNMRYSEHLAGGPPSHAHSALSLLSSIHISTEGTQAKLRFTPTLDDLEEAAQVFGKSI